MKKKTRHNKKERAFSNQETLKISGELVYISAVIESYKSLGKSLTITERQREIFEDKFGINDGVIKTNIAVGQTFGISAMTVRQLFATVLCKMGCISPHWKNTLWVGK